MLSMNAPAQFVEAASEQGDDAVRSPSAVHGLNDFVRSPAGNAYSNSFTKRALDLLICFAALTFFAPLMLLIALAIRLTGPVFFKQQRIGRNGQMFHVYKFRTMAVDAEQRLADLLAADPVARLEWETLRKLTHDPRITLLGRFLRLSSLDELDQVDRVSGFELDAVDLGAVHHHVSVLLDFVAFDDLLTLDLAVDGTDQVLLEALMAVLARPFEDQPGSAPFATPPKPEERVLATFCGT